MPQMAPLLWTPMFIMFSFLLMFVMTKILFSFLSSHTQIQTNNFFSKKVKMSWKW